MPDKPHTLRLFIAEAKRRHVFKTAALYAGGAFAVLQLADILMPTLGIDESAISNLLIIIAVGFPLALIAAWILDISGDGISVTEEISTSEKAKLSGPKLTEMLVIVIALGVGFLYVERFIGEDPEFERVTETKGETKAETEIVSTPLEPSIAVLPFENLSDSSENAYFAAGIHEDILNNLSQIGELIVTSRTSTLPYGNSNKPIPEIAEELNVNYVIEGSVRRAGNRVRISVQLIEAGNDSHLWSEAYDREMLDVFEVQQQIANEVSHALKIQFDVGIAAGEKPTSNLEAYELFLKARELSMSYEPENLAIAIPAFRRALELDPNYADAWAGLSHALSANPFLAASQDTTDEAKVAADKALERDPESWIANFAKAWTIGLNGQGAPGAALPFAKKAVEANPNNGKLLTHYGFELWYSGDARGAITQMLAAYRRDPLSAEANLARALVATLEGDVIATRKFVNKGIAIAPEQSYIHFWASILFIRILDYENALNHSAKVLALNPNHIGAKLQIADYLTSLGDYAGANYWLDQVEALGHFSPTYFSTRANHYALGGRAEEYQQHVSRWLEQDPDNLAAIRYKAFATARAALSAHQEEDLQAFEQLSQRALKENLEYINTQLDYEGNPTVTVLSTWNLLAAAFHASALGEEQTATDLCEQLIAYFDAQPQGVINARNLQLLIVHGLLGNTEQALVHAQALMAEEYRATWLLNSFGVIEDQYGVYHGLNENIIFKDVIAHLNQRNEDSLAALRQELPALFP